MNTSEIVKHILEGDEDFDPIDYVKSATNRESAVEVYNGPLVRVIQPLAAYTINNYIGDGNAWDDGVFAAVSKDGPLYLAVDKADHDNLAIFQPNTNKAWDGDGREQSWKDIPYMISAEKPTSKWEGSKNYNEDRNWLDLQQGLATFFMAQIAKKKNVGQWVKYLTMIGRTDLATNYARYLGRAKLPFGKSIDAVMAMQKAGKRSRNRIARLMKNQRNVKWGEKGFWLLFDDWADLADYFDSEDRRYDFKKNAEKIFGGDTYEWFDGADNKPEDVWSYLSDGNLSVIKQLLVNRTVYNSDGEEHLVTRENVEELTDDEIKDIVCDRGNKNDSVEDIYNAIRYGADDAWRSSQEGAYYDGYKHALMSALGVKEDDTVKWINVGKRAPDKKLEGGGVEKGAQKTMLGFWFPYSQLEEWIAKWKEDEYEDDYYGDIHDLALAYTEKVRPNEDYSGDFDTDYFNEQVAYHLDELEPTAPEAQADPNQPELPMSGESDPKQPEIERPMTVTIGNDLTSQVRHKAVPSKDARGYYSAMGGKVGDKDIYLRAEALLAVPFSRIEEGAGDVKIEFTASDEAAESVVPLLKELQKMGRQGSSRNVKIEDWDGKSSFGFDGDGASKLGDIKVNGQTVESLLESGEEVDPKKFTADIKPTGFIIRSPDEDGQILYLGADGQIGHDPMMAAVMQRPEAEHLISELTQYFPGYAYEIVPDFRVVETLMEAIYKRSTTQIDLPKEIGGHIIQWGELNIADEDLYIDEKDGCGRETEQHVTVLYGLTDPTPPEALMHIVQTTKPFLVEFGGISVFENPKYDVIKLDVISEELHNLHMEIRRSCPNENKFPDYIPHCTIAYVQKGKGKKYAGQDVFKSAQVPRDFWAYALKFKGAGDSEDGNRVVQLISFDNSKPIEEPDEPEAGEQRYPEATREEPELAVAESEVKSFLARNVPVDCPECHSHNLTEPDEEGLVDCLDCGIWFNPLHPENRPVAESVDPKQFTQGMNVDQRDWLLVDSDPQTKSKTYRHNVGRVQYVLSYLGRGKFRVHVTSVPDGSAMSDWEDFRAESHSEAEATAMNLAYDMVHMTDPGLFRPHVRENEEVDPKQFLNSHYEEWVVVADDPKRQHPLLYLSDTGVQFVASLQLARKFSDEAEARSTVDLIRSSIPKSMRASLNAVQKPVPDQEIDTKALVARVPHHELQHWDEAGPEGGYRCSCGQWRYKLTGWSSSIPNAMKEFRAHKRLANKKQVSEAEELNAKEFLNRTTQYRVRMGVGAMTKYLHQEGQQLTWHDFESATLFNSEDAAAMIDRIGETYGGQPVVAELVDDPDSHVHENDAKVFLMGRKTYRIYRDDGMGVKTLTQDGWWRDSAAEAGSFSEQEAAKMLKKIERMNKLAKTHIKVWADPVLESLRGPFEDDGLPGEVTSFLRKVRSKRRPAKQQVI